MPGAARRAALAGATALLVLAGLAGCRSATTGAAAPTTTVAPAGPATTAPAPPPTAPRGTGPSTGTTRLHAGDLGVSVELPSSFGNVESGSLTLVARSNRPPAVFSVDRADPGVVDHRAEPGEVLRPTTVSGLPAVEVLSAAVPGLPAGIRANELLVANGDRSFSVILSAAPQDLDAIWARVLATLAVDR